MAITSPHGWQRRERLSQAGLPGNWAESGFVAGGLPRGVLGSTF